MIDREDMLELTRRMTPSRTCFDRIAGAYINDLGEVDDSFNIHFGKLSGSEKVRNLELAKTIPFSKTNVQLKEYVFPEEPVFGFLYPAFSDRSGDEGKIDIFHMNPEKPEEGLMYKLLGKDY